MAARAADCPESIGREPDLDEGCQKRPPLNAETVPELNALKTPESPAFMVLGLAPSEIQRPTTPTGFALSTAAGLSRIGRLAPGESFALEASPYWLFAHPDLTAEDLEGQRLWGIVRNLSVSLASTLVPTQEMAGMATGSTEPRTRSAAGLRTSLFSGWQSGAARACQQFLRGYLDAESSALAAARQAFDQRWYAEHPRPTTALEPGPELPPGASATEEAAYIERAKRWQQERKRLREAGAMSAFVAWTREHDEALQAWLREYSAERPADPRVARCMNEIHDREGFMWDAAVAGLLEAPAGDLSRLDEGRKAVTAWSTLAFVPRDFAVTRKRTLLDTSFVLAYRWQHERGPMGARATRHDVGARVVLAIQRAGLSLEATRRFERSGVWSDPWRFALGVDFRLAGGAWFNATFAKEFGVADAHPLIALANVQWNFGLDRGVRTDAGPSQKGTP